MSKHFSADQVEQQYVESMGPELGKLFYELWTECAWLHTKWNEHVTLFGSRPERIELLNDTAPIFFRIVQDSLWEDVLLHITRLTDPPKSAGKQNLTLQCLVPLVDDQIRPRLMEAVEKLKNTCDFARDWRMRRIAHRDLALVLGSSASPLAHASRQNVRLALSAIEEFLNLIDMHYRNASNSFEAFAPFGNAEQMLYVLRDGLIAEKQRQARLESGRPEPDDINPLPAV